MKYKLGILATHPIQYFSPLYRALAAHPEIDLHVYFAHRQTPEGQSSAGFGVPFEWDLPILEGYPYQFLHNQARYPSTDTAFGCDTPEIQDIIAREHFDAFIVSGWYSRSYWQAMRACWKTKTPLFIRGDSQLGTARSGLKLLLKWPLYRWVIPRFDGYLIVGKRAREYFLHYGAALQNMFSVPHAVDNRYFAESSAVFRLERAQHRQEWRLPAKASVFLFVGKLISRKRPMDFLRALERASHGASQAYGLVVGDGSLRQELERYAQDHHVPVRFVGFQNQAALPKAYAVSDALVLPSDGSETWGLVVNEAMASGLPALVSEEVGCSPDLVISGKTGNTFKGGDWEDLGRLLQDWATHPESLALMGVAATKMIENYSVEQGVKGIREAMKKMSYDQKS